MHVRAVTAKDGAQLANVVLETPSGDLALGFLIPMNEANRLARVLGLSGCPCVPIYELTLSLLDRLGGSLCSALLDGDGSRIHSRLIVEHSGGRFELSTHPADAIALALRGNAPIYATAAALRHACALADKAVGHAPDHRLAEWLDRVTPADFRAGR